MEYFNGCLGAKMDMLGKVDFCKAALAEQAHELVVAKPLSCTIGHAFLLL